MRRFWLIMLSVGLVAALITPAFALDVQFSGSYYAAGMYEDQVSLIKGTPISKTMPNMNNESTAFYFQRLRVETDFIVSPGLSLITRFTALERVWGGPRAAPSAYNGEHLRDPSDSWYFTSAGTTAENENIAFDWAYIKYASPIGIFTVGYQEDLAWGTVFGNNTINGAPWGTIGWSLQLDRWTLLAQIVKLDDFSNTAIYPSTVTDGDADEYFAGFIYRWKGGEAGARYLFYRNAVYKPSPGHLTALHSIQPYAIAKIGPVTIQAELNYYWGDDKYEDGITTSIRLDAINFFLDAVADFNMFYFGGTFAYLSGDNPNTTDRVEGGPWLYWSQMANNATGGGLDWNPCLIMFNFDRTYWAGYLQGYNGTFNGSPMQNAWFGQLRGGVRPIAALNIMASVSYAMADQPLTTAIGWASDKSYGWELDVTGTYKITNNLSYMLGVGYWWVGDFYRATNTETSAPLRDEYLIISKLTLAF
ncbi:MAG: hypothetical protein ABSC54_02730 [Smithellaceae bacterium]